jgi:hypothetical protein
LRSRLWFAGSRRRLLNLITLAHLVRVIWRQRGDLLRYGCCCVDGGGGLRICLGESSRGKQAKRKKKGTNLQLHLKWPEGSLARV